MLRLLQPGIGAGHVSNLGRAVGDKLISAVHRPKDQLAGPVVPIVEIENAVMAGAALKAWDCIIGVPMEVVVGVILRQVGEIAQPHQIGLLQSQAGVFQQDGIHLLPGDFGAAAVRVCPAVTPVDDQPPLLLADGAGIAGPQIEQLVQVDVRRMVIPGSQELVANGEIDVGISAAAGPVVKEGAVVEIGQLLGGKRNGAALRPLAVHQVVELDCRLLVHQGGHPASGNLRPAEFTVSKHIEVAGVPPVGGGGQQISDLRALLVSESQGTQRSRVQVPHYLGRIEPVRALLLQDLFGLRQQLRIGDGGGVN